MATNNLLNEQALKDPNKLITPAVATTIAPNANQLINPTTGQVGAAHTAGNANVVGQASYATPVQQTPTQTVSTQKVTGDVNKALESIQAAQGTVSNQAQVQAATALPSANATVAGQLEKLMAQFEGGETPPWAAGAKRMVDSVMAQRGMGASTMAASASTQAMMESALEIAVRDASTFSAFEMTNLNHRQQARLHNAQAFLQMDLANLDNRQQTILFKGQARIQSLFSDQAAENATRQFNATSKNQADQFFANLSTQVRQFNSEQHNAMRMFNSEQTNAVKMFNAQVRNQRDQFNAQNRLVIDQANAKWRQEIATVNNAQINEANRINAQLATGMTTAAYNNMMQRERDLMSFVFTSAENENQRAHEIILQKLQNAGNKSVAKAGQKNALFEAAGKFVSNLLF